MEETYIKVAAVVVIILIILLIYYLAGTAEKFDMLNNLGGMYVLQPMFSNDIKANRAVNLRVIPQAGSPNFLTLIVYYANGKNKIVKTNQNVGNIFTYYNDYENVQYRIPSNIQYDLHTDNGLFRAITDVNGSISLMGYQIVSRVS